MPKTLSELVTGNTYNLLSPCFTLELPGNVSIKTVLSISIADNDNEGKSPLWAGSFEKKQGMFYHKY